MKRIALFALGFVALVACTRSYPPPPRYAGDTDGPVNCAAEEFKAHERCFARARDACDSLACPEGCDIGRARTSKWVYCSFSRASSSMLVRCGGIANWLCPENAVCADDPASQCKHSTGLDCTGICVAKASAVPLARCEGFSGWTCPEGQVCADDPRPGACSRTNDDDCEGVCVPATRP